MGMGEKGYRINMIGEEIAIPSQPFLLAIKDFNQNIGRAWFSLGLSLFLGVTTSYYAYKNYDVPQSAYNNPDVPQYAIPNPEDKNNVALGFLLGSLVLGVASFSRFYGKAKESFPKPFVINDSTEFLRGKNTFVTTSPQELTETGRIVKGIIDDQATHPRLITPGTLARVTEVWAIPAKNPFGFIKENREKETIAFKILSGQIAALPPKR